MPVKTALLFACRSNQQRQLRADFAGLGNIGYSLYMTPDAELLAEFHASLGTPLAMFVHRPIWYVPSQLRRETRAAVRSLQELQKRDMKQRQLKRPPAKLAIPTVVPYATDVWLRLDHCATSKVLDPEVARSTYLVVCGGDAALLRRYHAGTLRLRARSEVQSPKATIIWARTAQGRTGFTLSKAGLLLLGSYAPAVHMSGSSNRTRSDRVECEPLAVLGKRHIYDERDWTRAKKRGKVKPRKSKVRKARKSGDLSATEVIKAAEVVGAESAHHVGDKVFLGPLVEHLRTRGNTEISSQLLRLHRAGAIELSRCDMPGQHPEGLISTSTLRHPKGAEFHYVRVPHWLPF